MLHLGFVLSYVGRLSATVRASVSLRHHLRIIARVRRRLECRRYPMLAGLLALIGLGFALGLRHGIDWDHIAAITDITSSAVTNGEAEAEGQMVAVAAGVSGMRIAVPIAGPPSRWRESRQGLFLASMYALGHGTLVVVLGLLAIWLGA